MKGPLSLLVPTGLVLLVYATLVGAAQLPEHIGLTFAATWLLPAGVLLWDRSARLKSAVYTPASGIGYLLFLFGPLLALWYLLRTRRDRHWGLTVILAGLAFAPMLGYVSGQLAATLVPIPPRYVELEGRYRRVTRDLASEVAQADFRRLAQFLTEERGANRPLPADADELYARWIERHPYDHPPYDLFTGGGYYYGPRDTGYGLWSAGPDRQLGTEDDPWFVWPPLAQATSQ
jgi:hypothetical protein